ncbi:MAG: response regulator [Candidatus Poseidoniales archaeon]
MGLVSETNDDSAPTVLIVDNNPMSINRLKNVFRVKNFNIEICEDGDQAVDEYIRIDPELVVMALDLPSLDGHIAALEMREHGGDQRIIFVAPKRMLSIAKDAAFSAGAVALLEKPVTTEALDEVWDTVLGDVPEAPGLEDLDELYPGERIKVEEDTGPILPQLPPLPLPLPVPELDELPVLLPPTPTAQPKKKKGKGKLLFGLLIIVAGALGVAYQQGMLPV